MAKLTRAQRRANAVRLAERTTTSEHIEEAYPVETAEVMRAVTAPMDISVQPRFESSATVFSSVYRWVMTAKLEEPLYSSDSTKRDKWLREFVLREPHLVGVLNSVTQIDGNRGWTLTGGRNQVNRFTGILHDNYYVTPDTYGWRPGIKAAAQSYYSSDMGAVIEVGRDGQGGPLRGLFHVDSSRCRMSGDPEYPLYYMPMGAGQQEWTQDDYFRISSLVSTDEAMRGLGFCAVSRCLELAKVMVAVYLHDQEQLGARAPRGLLLLKNISQTAWDDAMTARDEQMQALERQYYGGLAVLAGMGPDDVDAKLIALSQLPLNFDLEKFTSLLMYGYALAFGYDPREFWPVSGGQLGTATETEVQHQKATGKGGLDFALAFQEHLQRLLPPTLQYEFEQRDDNGAILEAQLEQAQIAGPKSLYESGLHDGAPIVTKEEVRILLAERGIIPEEWTQYEEEVTSTDIETAEQTEDVPVPGELPPVDTSVPQDQQPPGTPVSRERWLDMDPVRRAMVSFPDDDIIVRHWPSGRERVLWRAGERNVWSGVQRDRPKELVPVMERAGYDEGAHPRDEHGKFTSGGGGSSSSGSDAGAGDSGGGRGGAGRAKAGSGKHIKGTLQKLPPEERVWQGKAHPGKTKMSKLETGARGEAMAMESLEAESGVGYGTLNVGVNNAPIDAGGDHEAIEIKTGVATNSSSAQGWRATIGQPGKEETARLKKMSAPDKKEYNRIKSEKILERKRDMLNKMSKLAGKPVKPYMVGVILSPDGKRGDVFKVPGFHLSLRWKEHATSKNYIGTFKAGGK